MRQAVRAHKTDPIRFFLYRDFPDKSVTTMTQKPFFGNALVATAIAIIGLLIHGTEAGKLGLYWDDAGLFLGAMQNVDGDAVRFILRDAPNFLFSERPLA